MSSFAIGVFSFGNGCENMFCAAVTQWATLKDCKHKANKWMKWTNLIVLKFKWCIRIYKLCHISARRCMKCIWIGFNGAKRISFIFHGNVWLYICCFCCCYCRCYFVEMLAFPHRKSLVLAYVITLYSNTLSYTHTHTYTANAGNVIIIIIAFSQLNCNKCLNNSIS